MAKKTINFNKMNEKSFAFINEFAKSRIEIAKEDVRHAVVLKSLKAKLKKIQENRQIDINAGIPVDDVVAKFPTIEVEKEIKLEEQKHNDIVTPLRNSLTATYVFITEDTYDAYVKKINQGKRGDFLDAISQFLANVGIESVSQSALCSISEQISDRLGAKISTSKKLLKDGKFSCELQKSQFNKLFMSVICDILIQNKVISLDNEEQITA